MPPGRHGTITVSAVNCSHLIEVKITDTGSGISAKNLTHIFDPYFTTKKTGTGLGLAVVYSIVKHHGGNITVESVEDQGTTFTVTLPAIPVPLAEKTKGTTKTAISTKKGRLLIMDDEPSIRQLATIILGRSGFSITAVSDGKDVPTAYQAALNEGNPYDLVILDLTVPGGTGGLEAIGLLLKIDPQVHAVVSSGYSDDMGNTLKSGFKGVIPKPYTADQLIDAVNNLLSKS
jgi:CheY-like chemotaxis protein